MICSINPVETELIRNALMSASMDMRLSLTRSAFSPVIYESLDCSVGLFNETGEILAQAPGLPCFLGSLQGTLRLVIEKVGANNFREGDVYIVNDTYITGSHLNDVVVLSPVIQTDQLIGFAVTKAHWLDIGSATPGWPVIGTTEIYQEGIRFGPTKIVSGGELVRDIIDILARNSRFPDALIGDMNAQIAACRMGERRYLEVVERFGLTTVVGSMNEVFDTTELLEREDIMRIPDGIYVAEGFVDNDGLDTKPFLVRVTVTVEGSDITVDTTGSAKQRRGCTNSGLVQSMSYCQLAYKFLIRPDLGVTGGSFRPMKICIERGSIFDPLEPTSCLQYGTHTGLLVDLIIKALSDVIPHKVVAGLPRDPWNVYMTGWDPHRKHEFVSGEALAGGWGASSFGDGENAVIHLDAGDFKNRPTETAENRYPILILSYGLGTDSGGAGEFCGGLKVVKEYRILGSDCHLSLWFDMTVTPSWGLFGGKSGDAPKVAIIYDNSEEKQILKISRLPLPIGAVVRAETGGGGGYGPPKKRTPDQVREDVIDGYISKQKALQDYGVAFIKSATIVDIETTDAIRAEMN